MLRSVVTAIVLIVGVDGFRQHSLDVGTVDTRQEAAAKTSTRWEQCIWDGPDGSGFRAVLAMELGEKQGCKFLCRGARYEMDSRVLPGFFTAAEEEDSKCGCSVAGKKKYTFKKGLLIKECNPQTCWARYQNFLNWKQPRHRHISFSNMQKLDVTCTGCQSAEECKDSITLPTPWSISEDKSGGGGGGGDKTVAPEVSNFLANEGIEFVDSDTEDEEVELEDKGHNGNGEDVKELGTLTSDGETDEQDADESGDNSNSGGNDGGQIQGGGSGPGSLWQPDPAQLSECMKSRQDDKRAACVCGLATNVKLSPEQIQAAGATKLPTMYKMVMMQQCAVASQTAFEAVAPWGCGMHSWIRKCMPVYPTYAPQEDVDPSGKKAGGQSGSDDSTKDQKKTEKPKDKGDKKATDSNGGQVVTDKLPDNLAEDIGDVEDEEPEIMVDQVDTAVKECTLAGNSEDIAACTCAIANINAESSCESMSEKVVEFASPWACATHHALNQCVPTFALNPGKEDVKEEAEEQPVEYGPCGQLGSSSWWQAHTVFYSSLFDIVQDEHANIKALRCKFISKKHECLETRQMQGGEDGAPRMLTAGKNGADTWWSKLWSSRSNVMDVPLKCVRGEWVEPSDLEVQSCAYPLRPKNLVKAGHPDAGLEQERVLTIADPKTVDKSKKSGSNIVVQQWDRYSLQQYWIMDQDGLIRSAADPNQCLTAENPHNWITKTSGWWEGYLYTQSCTKYFGYKLDLGHKWWISSDFANRMRTTQKAGACGKKNSCCSLSFAAVSGGWVFGEATTGKFFMTFPKAEYSITDWRKTTYILQEDGEVREKRYLKLFDEDYFVPIGVLTNEDGTRAKVTPEAIGKRIENDFHLGSDETYPKILKSIKMSDQDMELSVIDFWKL